MNRLRLSHVIGARPNFMKAGPVIAALGAGPRGSAVDQQVIHTGQHYDEQLSTIFFRELGLPKPDINLGVGSGSHASQTAALLTGLERVFDERRPDAVIVYGDVNSTLAAALVCAKLHIPVVHVEAGLRSFDDTMPEEINRRLTDAVADLMLVTSPEGLDHLAREGRPLELAHLVGNTMIDTLLSNLEHFDPEPVCRQFGLTGDYGVVTLHRPANVDSPEAAESVANSVNEVAKRLPLLIPLHPRGRDRLKAAGLDNGPTTSIVDPLGYIDFLSLVRGSRLVLTDSGGVQEETTILDVPCLTMRTTTERPITITHGTNQLVSAELAPSAVDAILEGTVEFPTQRPPLWDGAAGQRCADLIIERYGT